MRWGWLFGFFFLAVLSSQSLLDLSSFLLCATAVYYYYKNRPAFPRFGIEKIIPVWLIVILLGLLAQKQPETPWLKNFLEFRWILELYLYALALREYRPSEKEFHRLLPILFVASLFAVAAYFLRFDPLTEGWNWAGRLHPNVQHRTGGLFSNPMPFAHTYGPLAILFLGPLFFWKRAEFLQHKFWTATALLTCFAVFLSFTRGVWVGMTLGFLLMGFLVNWKKGISAAGVLLLALVITWVSSNNFRERVLFSLSPSKTYDSERLIIWQANWLIFTENPILGLDYSENSRRLREYYDRMNVPAEFLESHAHNQYLHFLAGTGVLGLACFLLVIALMFRLHLLAYRRLSDPFWKGLALGVLGAEVAFFVAGITESNFSIAKNRYLILMIWALGAYLAYRSQQKELK